MGNFLGYMIFSTIEGFSVYALSLYLFRLNVMRYIGPVLLMIAITNLQSFIIREEPLLVPISPAINIVITILFITVFARIPIIWSMIMVATGFLSYFVIINLAMFLSFGYFTPEQVSIPGSIKGYELQFITGVIGTSIGWLLYKFGIGFTVPFEKLRFRWEPFFVISFVVAFLLGLCLMLYFKAVFANLLIVSIAFVIFLIYILRKDAEH